MIKYFETITTSDILNNPTNAFIVCSYKKDKNIYEEYISNQPNVYEFDNDKVSIDKTMSRLMSNISKYNIIFFPKDGLACDNPYLNEQLEKIKKTDK